SSPRIFVSPASAGTLPAADRRSRAFLNLPKYLSTEDTKAHEGKIKNQTPATNCANLANEKSQFEEFAKFVAKVFPPSSLVHFHPAIHIQRLAGDVARLR